MIGQKLAIDLGTTKTIVAVSNHGVVLNEPSIVATSNENEIIAIGSQAEEMIGRTPDIINAHQPIRNGVIADYRITEAMLKFFIDKTLGRFRFFRPDIMVSVPCSITSTERRAVVDVCKSAGGRSIYIIKEPLAAAIGSSIPVTEPVGNLIVNIGGGTTEVAIISLGGIVVSESIRVGGDNLDHAITNLVRAKHNLSIGNQTAREIKHTIGSATYLKQHEVMTVKGRDLVEGLPKTITINSTEITECLKDNLSRMISAVKNVLEKTPPELSADIVDQSVILTGGTSLLRNIADLMSSQIGLRCQVASDPEFSVVNGTALALEHIEIYQKSINTE